MGLASTDLNSALMPLRPPVHVRVYDHVHMFVFYSVIHTPHVYSSAHVLHYAS